MILDSGIEEEEIDEALKHLSNTIRNAINESRKNVLLEMVDELLDAKNQKGKQ
jgi:hypothetical protein